MTASRRQQRRNRNMVQAALDSPEMPGPGMVWTPDRGYVPNQDVTGEARYWRLQADSYREQLDARIPGLYVLAMGVALVALAFVGGILVGATA